MNEPRIEPALDTLDMDLPNTFLRADGTPIVLELLKYATEVLAELEPVGAYRRVKRDQWIKAAKLIL